MVEVEVDKIKDFEFEQLNKQDIESDKKTKHYNQIQVKEMIFEKLKKNEETLQNYIIKLNQLNDIDIDKLKNQIKKLEEKAIKHNFFKDSISDILERKPTITEIQKIIKQRKEEAKSVEQLYKSIKSYLGKIDLSDKIYVDLEIYDRTKLESNINEVLTSELDTSSLSSNTLKDGGLKFSQKIIKSMDDEQTNKTNKILAAIYWTLNETGNKMKHFEDFIDKFGKGAKIITGLGLGAFTASASAVAASAITGSTIAGVSVAGSAATTAGGISAGITIGATSLLGTAILTIGVIGAGIAAAGLVVYGLCRLFKWFKNRKK